MTSKLNMHDSAAETLSHMLSWVTSTRAQVLEDVAFLSGAALATLQLVLGRHDMPQTLLRARLALSAAEACVAFSGRPERAADLRDAVHLLRPGDLPGPAGEVYLCWQRAVERPVSIKALHRALPMHLPDKIAGWLDAPSTSCTTSTTLSGSDNHFGRFISRCGVAYLVVSWSVISSGLFLTDVVAGAFA